MGTLDLKLVLLGHKNVGKTCVFNRYVYDQFGRTTMTIGAYFGMRECCVDNKKVNLAIWDTAGEEKFDSLTNFYCRGARAALICYDITNRQTFTELSRWVSKIKIEAEGCAIIIVGTKLDMCEKEDSSKRQVSTTEGKTYADSVDAKFLESSAKTGHNIDAVFEQVVRLVFEQGGNMSSVDGPTVDPNGPSNSDDTPCC